MDLKEATQLLKDGWIPRVKTVKGRNYITLRKGVHEKSLGPYEKEYWRIISQQSNVTHKSSVEEIEDLKDAIAKINNTIGTLKAALDKLTSEQALENLRQLREDVGQLKISFTFFNKTARWRVSKDAPENHCESLTQDGYCLYSWDQQQDLRPQKQDDQGHWHDNVQENPVICVACPNYKPKRDTNEQQSSETPPSTKSNLNKNLS